MVPEGGGAWGGAGARSAAAADVVVKPFGVYLMSSPYYASNDGGGGGGGGVGGGGVGNAEYYGTPSRSCSITRNFPASAAAAAAGRPSLAKLRQMSTGESSLETPTQILYSRRQQQRGQTGEPTAFGGGWVSTHPGGGWVSTHPSAHHTHSNSNNSSSTYNTSTPKNKSNSTNSIVEEGTHAVSSASWWEAAEVGGDGAHDPAAATVFKKLLAARRKWSVSSSRSRSISWESTFDDFMRCV